MKPMKLTVGPTPPVKTPATYICQACLFPIELGKGGSAYRHSDGRHTHLDSECVDGIIPLDNSGVPAGGE